MQAVRIQEILAIFDNTDICWLSEEPSPPAPKLKSLRCEVLPSNNNFSVTGTLRVFLVLI